MSSDMQIAKNMLFKNDVFLIPPGSSINEYIRGGGVQLVFHRGKSSRGGAKISWGGIFGGKRGMWRLGGDLGEDQEAAKCSHSLDQPCIEQR